MAAIATVGAYECLRSGVTTIGDCSFAGASALAAAATGLRAIVYLEVFGRDASALDRFHELHERAEPAVSDRVAVGVSPHAPYTCTLEVYEACASLGLPQADALRRERRRAPLARRRHRRLGAARRPPRATPGRRGSGCSRRQGCSVRT